MTKETVTTDLDTILAAKRQYLAERRARTPIAAVIALADMQRRPQPILNTVTNGSQITLIGQVTRSDTYDPVAATLRYVREGVDAVALFTDQNIYSRGLDDLLLVSRGVNIPVINQDYILDEYHVVEARAAGASALLLSASMLDQPTLRKVVTATQRWRMTAIVQISTAAELAYAQTLSPHVLGVGGHNAHPDGGDIELYRQLRPLIPYNVRCMVTSYMQTIDEVQAVVELGVDAVLVTEQVFSGRSADQLRQLLNRPHINHDDR